MSGEFTLQCPAPAGLSGAAATHIPRAWITTTAALAAGWLSISSEISGRDRHADEEDGLAIGPSDQLSEILSRAAERTLPREASRSFSEYDDSLLGFRSLLEQTAAARGVSARLLVPLMAQFAVSVRRLSYGSPINATLNVGPLGEDIRLGVRALVDFPGYRRGLQARNLADEGVEQARLAGARADAQEAQVRELRAIAERQHLESLAYRRVDVIRIRAALRDALAAGDAPPELAAPVASALASVPGVAAAVDTTLAVGGEVVDEPAPDDIWFAAP